MPTAGEHSAVPDVLPRTLLSKSPAVGGHYPDPWAPTPIGRSPEAGRPWSTGLRPATLNASPQSPDRDSPDPQSGASRMNSSAAMSGSRLLPLMNASTFRPVSRSTASRRAASIVS